MSTSWNEMVEVSAANAMRMKKMADHTGAKGIPLKISGRVMKMYTDQPCVQLYTGNFLADDGYPFKGGFVKSKQIALCLETQHMPDSMHHEGFTDVTLDEGEIYDHTTVYAFSAE